METLLERSVIAAFDQQGYVVTEDLISVAELQTFGAAVDSAVQRRTVSDDRALAKKSAYEQSFTQCMRLWETDPDVRPLTFHARLAQVAAELLGVETLRLWQDQALYKEPGGRLTDAHQDAPFWPVGDAPMISAWIPFEGSRVEQGATAYIPGSHKLGRLRTVDLTRPTEAYNILSDPALAGAQPVEVEAKIGSVVWHHGLTVHTATPNITAETRRVFTVVYLADGYRRAKDWPVFPLDRAGVGVGEPMAGDGMPIVWPRSAMPPWPEPPDVIGEPTGPQMDVPQL